MKEAKKAFELLDAKGMRDTATLLTKRKQSLEDSIRASGETEMPTNLATVDRVLADVAVTTACMQLFWRFAKTSEHDLRAVVQSEIKLLRATIGPKEKEFLPPALYKKAYQVLSKGKAAA